MSGDFKTAKTALAKLHQDMEAINRLATPSYLSVIEQMERTMEPIRRHQLKISRAMELSGAAARIKDIIGANQHWQELIKQATATSSIAEVTAHSPTPYHTYNRDDMGLRQQIFLWQYLVVANEGSQGRLGIARMFHGRCSVPRDIKAPIGFPSGLFLFAYGIGHLLCR